MTQVEDALARLNDRQEVADLWSRYARGMDTRDWDTVRGVFCADVEASHSLFEPAPDFTPPPAEQRRGILVDQIAGGVAANDYLQHYISNVEVELSGDSAETTASLFLVHHIKARPDGELIFEGGRYTGTAIRTEDGWRLRRMRVESTWLEPAARIFYGLPHDDAGV